MSVTPKIEHRDFDESDDTILEETIVMVIEPTTLKFDDDILSIEYESFSCGFDVNVGLDVDLCVEYESFSFEPIPTDLLFGNCKSEFVESESITNKEFALEYTYTHIGLNRLVHFALTILPRLILHDNPISRPMTHLLADFKYVYLFPDWAQLFDKLKRTLTYAALIRWMYFTWHQLFYFFCIDLIESWSSVFDKLLRTLTSFDLGSDVPFDMEWLMLHRPLFAQISGGIA